MIIKSVVTLSRNNVFRRQRSLVLIWIGFLFLAFSILNFRPIKVVGNVRNEEFDWMRRSRNLSTYIRPTNLTHLKVPVDLRRFENSSYSCFVVTAPAHKSNRDAIRRTWGQLLKPIFIMGRNKDDFVMEALIDEAEEHDDIILEDFLDTYNNLTLKTAFVLKNFLLHFKKSKFLLKIDDDVLINPVEIDKMLNSGEVSADLMGEVVPGSKAHRDKESKWYLPHWLYGELSFPPYIHGPAIIFKGDSVETILRKAINDVPIIHLEDVYFTGIIASQILHLKVEHNPNFRNFHPFFRNVCVYRNAISLHDLTPELIEIMWDEVSKETLTKSCDSTYNKFLLWISKMFFI